METGTGTECWEITSNKKIYELYFDIRLLIQTMRKNIILAGRNSQFKIFMVHGFGLRVRFGNILIKI